VLCRAILEAALTEKVDPRGVIENQVQRDNRDKRPKRSYFLTLIETAESKRLLIDERPMWARKVKDAGDWAIHDIKKFDREFPAGKLGDIVLNARKGLIDLYSYPQDRIQAKNDQN
jgi:hypothetical protein